MRKSWVPYLQPPASVSPPAAAPRRNVRRLTGGSRRSSSAAMLASLAEPPRDLPLVFGKVPGDHGQLERAQDRLLRLALEEKFEGQADEIFDGHAPAGERVV